MAKYIKYNASNANNVLIGKNESQQTGNISKISICNERPNGSTDTSFVSIYLHDGNTSNDIYIIKQIDIPPTVTLVLEDNLSFNISRYSLRINVIASGTSEQLSIIIK